MPVIRKRKEIAAVFDLDGTLLNTLPSLVASCNLTLERLGLPPFEEAEIKGFVGRGRRALVERMMAAAGQADRAIIDEAHRIYRQVFAELSTHKVVPFEGIPAMLEDIMALGLKLGVVTNKSQKATPAVLATSFPPGLFSAVRGGRRWVPLKPDPRSTLGLLRQLGADPARSYFIGDSDIDILTGRAAGMHTIGAKWGFRAPEELEALAPDLLAARPREVSDYIRRTLGRVVQAP